MTIQELQQVLGVDIHTAYRIQDLIETAVATAQSDTVKAAQAHIREWYDRSDDDPSYTLTACVNEMDKFALAARPETR